MTFCKSWFFIIFTKIKYLNMKKIFTILGLISTVAFMNAQIVINEVYGGGGNANAPYTHDFVELINRGTTTITLSGASLQYAATSGTFNSYQALPNITLSPGQTYLIQEYSNGAVGVALPTPDFAPTTNTAFSNGQVYTTALNIAGSNGKVALASSLAQVVSPTDSHVIDFVGYGTANLSEGTAAPAASNTLSVSRTNGIDTNNNSVDFTAGAPTPQNSGSVLAVSDLNKTKSNFIKNTFVKNEEITFGADVKDVKVYNLSGAVVKTGAVKNGSTLNVAELQKGNYIVTGTVNNQPVSQKILKD